MRLAAAGLAARRGERLLFSGLDFTLAPGQLLLITGPNGAGKTTLLRLVAGALTPEDGTLVWQGIDEDARPQALMHLLSHRTAIKPRLTLSEDLAFWQAVNGPGPDAFEALDRVGLGGLDWLEAGLLSAGQQRRLALARLIVSPRPVWLLDEPTAALDAEGDAMVAALLADHLGQGGLALCATHLPLALEGADIVRLRLGAPR
ncbi:heme ABC exporter ATP-binding protein CcmA [Devosia enhydra]|uniref:heme ABC exporter ATP-binding protein CcmA n=1 Tax=Devosia enhydra TaxID=665118 RepID=UPI000931C688|nr:heme ABC exporter ATP-binding protein CcmA [Devosia enhydra]